MKLSNTPICWLSLYNIQPTDPTTRRLSGVWFVVSTQQSLLQGEFACTSAHSLSGFVDASYPLHKAVAEPTSYRHVGVLIPQKPVYHCLILQEVRCHRPACWLEKKAVILVVWLFSVCGEWTSRAIPFFSIRTFSTISEDCQGRKIPDKNTAEKMKLMAITIATSHSKAVSRIIFIWLLRFMITTIVLQEMNKASTAM